MKLCIHSILCLHKQKSDDEQANFLFLFNFYTEMFAEGGDMNNSLKGSLFPQLSI